MCSCNNQVQFNQSTFTKKYLNFTKDWLFPESLFNYETTEFS